MRKILAALLLCFSFQVSHAALVDNGTWTTDTTTSLDWLDLTQTNELSYNQVSSQLGNGGLWEGWRYATASEAINLLTVIGFAAGTDGGFSGSQPATYTAAHALYIQLFGDIQKELNPLWSGAMGIVGNVPSNGFHNVLGALTIPSNYYSYNSLTLALPDYGTYLDVGHFLVRDSIAPVPLPAAAWLLLSGLAGLGYVGRRKAR